MNIDIVHGTGDIVQQLKVFAALPEDVGSISSTHIGYLTVVQRIPCTVRPPSAPLLTCIDSQKHA